MLKNSYDSKFFMVKNSYGSRNVWNKLYWFTIGIVNIAFERGEQDQMEDTIQFFVLTTDVSFTSG